MLPVLEKLSEIGIVPVVKIDRAEDAVPLAEALARGGLPCAEITFRTDAAAAAVASISHNFPSLLVGAGTVLTPGQADEAMRAGAQFLVSPGLNPRVVKHCMEKGYPIVPGTCSPSDLEQAIELGLDVVKFFPAEPAGGLSMIRALAAPYNRLKFMPTGGIGPQNLISYLDDPHILACGGSWMVPSDKMLAGDFSGIEQLTREAVSSMLALELSHVCLYEQDDASACETAAELAALLGFSLRQTERETYAGNSVSFAPKPAGGSIGHLVIQTRYLRRAARFYRNRGAVLLQDDREPLKALWFQREFAGFRICLTQR